MDATCKKCHLTSRNHQAKEGNHLADVLLPLLFTKTLKRIFLVLLFHQSYHRLRRSRHLLIPVHIKDNKDSVAT